MKKIKEFFGTIYSFIVNILIMFQYYLGRVTDYVQYIIIMDNVISRILEILFLFNRIFKKDISKITNVIDLYSKWYDKVRKGLNNSTMRYVKVYLTNIRNGYKHTAESYRLLSKLYYEYATETEALFLVTKDEDRVDSIQQALMMSGLTHYIKTFPERYLVFSLIKLLQPSNDKYFKLEIPESSMGFLQATAKNYLEHGDKLTRREKIHLQNIIEGNLPYGFKSVKNKK